MSKKHKNELRRQTPGFPTADDPNAKPDVQQQEAKVHSGEPVALLGKTQGDAAKTAHEEGLKEATQLPTPPASPAEQEPAAQEQEKAADPAGEPEQPEPPRTDHLNEEGKPVYIQDFYACLYLAFGDLMPDIENIDLVPFELAMFFRGEPDAPENAGLMHLKLKLNSVLLPNEDPRRVELAMKLFRTAIAGVDAIERADAAQKQAAAQPELPTARNRLDGEGPFDQDEDRLEKSGTGKALEQRAV